MEDCFQGKQTIKQHGESVCSHTRQLVLGKFEGFKLPRWFIENHHFIINNLCDWNILKQYNLMHDCGKPFCITQDKDGKKHFPNHAEVSKQIYLEVFPKDTEVAELIGLDMLLHTCNLTEIESLNLSNKILMSLLVTSFAEIHANAELFGGLTSASFNIKLKKLSKVGKYLIAGIPKHQEAHSYIIVRKDLSNAQIVVQSCHAAWEAAKYEQPSLVCLGVGDESELKNTMELLLNSNIQFYIYREPYYGNSITAICTEPLKGEARKVLSNYQLL